MRGPPSALDTDHARLAPMVEALETRLLYSADLAPLILAAPAASEPGWAAMATPVASTAASDADHAQASSSSVLGTTHRGVEIVFIDSTVQDPDQLLADLKQQMDQGRSLEVVLIDATQDGLDRITQTLADRQDIGAVHLVGHGQAGQMHLGNSVLDQDTLMLRAADIARWGASLHADADILLYGCDVGHSADGRALVDGLAALTGADVAANANATGGGKDGSDWTLEVQQGRIDSILAFTEAAQAQWAGLLTTAMPSGKGGAVWTNASTGPSQSANWDGVTLGQVGNTAVNASWTVLTSAQSHMRDEAIVVGVDKDDVLRGQMWNGTTWVALPMNPLSTSAIDNRQSFAVAYEQQSGDALLVWANGSQLNYSIWNGTSWSATASYEVGGGTVQRVQIAHKPGSDQMVLALSDSNHDDHVMIWDGSQFTQRITLDTSGDDSLDQLALAVAYEAQSGTAMVAYGKNDDPGVYFRMFNGLSWSAESSAGNFGSAGATLSISLASDPNSDRLVMSQTILVQSGFSFNSYSAFGIWDGNSWGSRTVPGFGNFPLSNGITADAAFESVSGDVLAVYQSGDNNVRYLTWSQTTGWSGSTTGPAMGDTQATMRLSSDPTSNHIVLGTITSNRALSFTDWDGANWNTRSQVSGDAGTTSTPAFTWIWRHQASLPSTSPSLWLGPSGSDSDGWNGVNAVTGSQVLTLSDPGLAFGANTTGGTFSHVFDASAWGAGGMGDLVWVSQKVTLTAGFELQRGDILFTLPASGTLSSLNSVTVNNNDVVLFRPQAEGDYSKGSFTVLVQGLGASVLGGSPNVRGLALVEQDLVMGDVTLTAGTILFTLGNGNGQANDIHRFVPFTSGLLGGLLSGTSGSLILGSDLGINKAIAGLEVVNGTTTLKDITLTTGQLLLTLADTSPVANTSGVAAGDVVLLEVAKTSLNSQAQATSSILLKGSALGFSGLPVDSLALFIPAGLQAPVITGDTAFTVPEFTTAAITTVTATDSSSDVLTFSIVGGSDQGAFTIDATTGVLRFVAPPDAHTPGDADEDNIYQVTVRASDGTLSDQQNLLIQVQPINRAPVNVVPVASTITEDTALSLAGLLVSDVDAGSGLLKVTLSVSHGTITLLDDVANGLTSSDIAYSTDRRTVVLTGTSSAINATLQDINGALYLPDAHYTGSDTLTITTDDQGHSGLPDGTTGLTDTDTMVITITAVNDAPVITSNGAADSAAISVPEFTTAPVATVAASDVDSTALTYSLAGGEHQALFTIDATTGVLRFASPPDTAVASTYTVVVRASDGLLHDEQTLTVTLQPINRAPVNTVPGDQIVAEDTALFITGLQVADVDAAGLPITVTLSVAHGTLSILNSVPGGLQSTDIAYASDGRSVVLTGSQAAINATLQATQGVRYLADLDYAGSDTLTITTNDQGHSGLPGTTASLSDQDTVAITVTPVTDAPTLTLGPASGQEDQVIALNLQALVGDIDNSLGQNERITQLTLSGLPTGATFTNTAGDALTASAGVLTLQPGQWTGLSMSLPADVHGSWSLTVTAQAQDGTADTAVTTATWNVFVQAVNDAPVITSNGAADSAAISVPEFTTAPVATVEASDVDSTALTYSLAGGEHQALFTIDATTGVLRFASPPDTAVASTYTVVVRASDGLLHDEQTLTVTLQPINRAPVNTVPGDQIVAEDTALFVTGLQVADVDAAGLPITVTLSVAHGTLSILNSVPGGLQSTDIAYASDGRSVVLTGSQAAINATLQAAQGVRYLADLDYAGSDTLTITTNDQGHSGLPGTTASLSDQDTVAITVTPVTDAPSLTLGPASGLEDQVIALNLQALVGDTDNSLGQNERITQLTLSGLPTGATFTNTAGDALTASAGVLTLQPGQWTGLSMSLPADVHGSWSLTVTAQAQDGTADTAVTTATWNVSVQAVNDAPVVIRHGLSISQGGAAMIELEVRDVDTPVGQLVLQVETVEHGRFEMVASGESVTRFTVADVQSGAVRFTHDGGARAPTYTLSISDGTTTTLLPSGNIRFALAATPVVEPEDSSSQDPDDQPAEPANDTAPEVPVAAGNETLASGSVIGDTSTGEEIDVVALPETLGAGEVRIALGNGQPFVLDLSPRETPSYDAQAPIDIETNYTWLGSLQGSNEYMDDLRRNLEALQQQLKEQGQERREVIASSIALSTGLSVGYVIWLVRGGALLGSMLSAMPAWAMIDPLPVLARSRADQGQGGDQGTDTSVEELFDDHEAPAPRTAPPEALPTRTPAGLAPGQEDRP